MNYFDMAVALTRAEAAPTLAKLATKYRAIKRIADGTYDDTFDLDEANRAELEVFDRSEASAINSEAC